MWDNIDRMLSLSLPHSLPSSLFSFFLSPFLSFSVLLNLSLSLFYSFFISFSLSLFLYLILHICTYPLKLFVVLWPSVFSIPSILVLQFNPTNWATIVMAELKNISSSFLCLWSFAFILSLTSWLTIVPFFSLQVSLLCLSLDLFRVNRLLFLSLSLHLSYARPFVPFVLRHSLINGNHKFGLN